MSNSGLQIEARHREIVAGLLRRYVPQCEVWAFGSRVRGDAKPYSDLDLAIATSRPLPLTTLADLACGFEDSALPFKVDIVDWATTSEPFRQIILAAKVVVQPAS